VGGGEEGRESSEERGTKIRKRANDRIRKRTALSSGALPLSSPVPLSRISSFHSSRHPLVSVRIVHSYLTVSQAPFTTAFAN